MSRPALIIGLGGTGQWVLTYLKKDLMEKNGGQMPDNVRLLAFDTVKNQESKVKTSGGVADKDDYESETKRVGLVELARNTELVYIGGDCFDLGQRIKQRDPAYRHLYWFDAEYWERNLTREEWYLDRGAGRFRQFGMLSIFKDLLGGFALSEILKRLPGAINEVAAKAEGNSFEMFFVGSVAGGTGSSMLIPMGVLARALVPKNVQVRPRAVVVLPSAFSADAQNSELNLRAHSALRELARVMMPPEGYEAEMVFLPGDNKLGSVKYNRPFNEIFFVDGTRNGVAISQNPKRVVFPAISTWIGHLLEKNSGEWFTQFVSANKKGSTTTDPKRMAEGVFTVFGVHTKFAPERELYQTYRLRLARKLLASLLSVKILQDPASKDETLVPELPSGLKDEKYVSREILTQSVRYVNEEQSVTIFLNAIAQIVNSGGANSADQVNNYALAGLKKGKGANEKSWVTLITDIPNTDENRDARQAVTVVLDKVFSRRFRPSNTYKPPRDPGSPQAYNDFTMQLDNWVTELYGGMGEAGLNDYGEFGAAMNLAAEAQVSVFARVLRLNVLRLLAEGSGRIQYTCKVLEALESDLSAFQKFIEEVSSVRGNQAPRVEIKGKATQTRGNWEKNRKKPQSLFEKLKKEYSAEANKAEYEYLNAWIDRISCIREDAALNSVLSAVQEMVSLCAKTRQKLERLHKGLYQGDTAVGLSGMLSLSQKRLNIALTNIQGDQRDSAIEELVQANNRDYEEIPEEDLHWCLKGSQWRMIPVDSGFEFQLVLKPEGLDQEYIIQVPSTTATKEETARMELQNLDILGNLVGKRFGNSVKVMPMIDWLRMRYPADQSTSPNVTTLADELKSEAAPLTHLGLNRGVVIAAAFATLDESSGDPSGWKPAFEKALKVSIAATETPDDVHPVGLLSSSDPYRLHMAICWTGLMLEEFATWEECNKTYELETSKSQGKTDDQVTEIIRYLSCQYTNEAEKEAIMHEVMWRRKGFTKRVINPRVVSLLGQKPLFRSSLQCFALGWISQVEDKDSAGEYHWEMKVPGLEYEIWLTPNADKDKFSLIQVLESLILVRKNNAPERAGSDLPWVEIQTALNEVNKLPDDNPAKLRNKVKEALAQGGMLATWEALKSTDPLYRDLVDVAKFYMEKM